jgi:hypothetical protein
MKEVIELRNKKYVTKERNQWRHLEDGRTFHALVSAELIL